MSSRCVAKFRGMARPKPRLSDWWCQATFSADSRCQAKLMWLTKSSQAQEVYNVKLSSLDSWCQTKVEKILDAKLIWSSTSSQSRQGFDAKPSLLSSWYQSQGFSISSQALEVFGVKPSSNSSWCQAKLKLDSRYQAKLRMGLLMSSQAPDVFDVKPSSNSSWCQAKLKQFLMPSQAQMESWC